MSDFIYTSNRQKDGYLGHIISSIYHRNAPKVMEFHGDWGSLGVSEGFYAGFAPIETETTILVIVGGPVLTFTSNKFIAGTDKTCGTHLLLDKMESGISWCDDVSGPFAVLRIDKIKLTTHVVTDLMGFIPVYNSEIGNHNVLSTHVDMIARASDKLQKIDKASMADFILNGVVTYPFTAYKDIFQLAPATVYQIPVRQSLKKHNHNYWLPKEDNQYKSVDHAAEYLRASLQNYVDCITEGLDHVALFLSGGEDSRAVLGMLPSDCQRDAFIFLDQMNREGKIAHSAAQAYGAKFFYFLRDSLRYLDVLPACSNLVGAGAEYSHVHTYDFDINCSLHKYKAVFGGFLSDTLLKGYYVKKDGRYNKFPFYYERPYNNNDRKHQNVPIKFEVLSEVYERHDKHIRRITNFRSAGSVKEYFNIWPISMHSDTPCLWGNRRLFSSYEIFSSSEVVKVSSSVPQIWKMNRVLFNKAFKPALKSTKYLTHANGWLPYFPWYYNSLFRSGFSIFRRARNRIYPTVGNQGPWNDWQFVFGSREWKSFADATLNSDILEDIFHVTLKALLHSNLLNTSQKINLIQASYQIQNIQ